MTDLNAYITKQEYRASEDGQLSDLRIAIKDNICTSEISTTCASKMLRDFEPPYTATVVDRLLSEGAVITGKTNMDEFGMGTTTETSYFGPTRNPVDTDYVPGGSSGGSAALVANGDVDVALGSDTGGSIRCPASFCGVIGLKPTYGLVSRYGLIAYANSLEQIGPIARNTEDIARSLNVLTGRDQYDPTTVNPNVSDYTDYLTNEVENLSVAVPTELVKDAEEPVKSKFWDTMHDLEDLGMTYQKTSIPSLEPAVESYYVIAMCEASSNLARFDGVRYGHSTDSDGDWNGEFSKIRKEGFGEEVKRRIMLGTYASSAGYQDKYYDKAQEIRNLIRSDFDEAFNEADVIATPTMPVQPFEIGESLDDPLKMYLADANTTPVNLANLPAISVPAGRSEGLPVGLQLTAPSFREDLLISLSYSIEKNIQ